MKLLISLAWRNLWRNTRRSLITISSVLFAVLLAIIFYSMEEGAYVRMIDTMVRYSTGYIQVQDVLYEEEPSIDNALLYDEEMMQLLEKFDDQIDFHVPRIQSFALAATSQQTRGTMIMGIDPRQEILLNDLREDLESGEFLDRGDPDIMIAQGLADIMELQPGDSLVLLGQGFQGTTASGIYRVKGIIRLALPDMNNNTIYMSLETAQWFFQTENRITGLIVMPHNPDRSSRLAETLQQQLDPEWFRVLTWEQMLSDLLALMQFDQGGTMIMLMILYIVIGFGLFGTILTMMMERQREFGMLFSLGMKRGQLAVVTFFESIFISFIGVFAGIIIAIPIIAYLYHNPIPLTGEMGDAMLQYGFEPVMPFAADPWVFFSQARIVLVISIIIGFYPVYRIFRLNIMEAKQA